MNTQHIRHVSRYVRYIATKHQLRGGNGPFRTSRWHLCCAASSEANLPPPCIAEEIGIASAMTDWLWRAAYKIGFRAARLWWWLRRPDHDGAVVAIWLNGRILVVQQSYRSNLSWPGGGIHRNEDPRDAARRELAEELGLIVSPDNLVFARDMVVDWDFRSDHVHIFELRLRAEPVIRIDSREITNARFVDPQVLLKTDNLPPFIRSYLSDLPS